MANIRDADSLQMLVTPSPGSGSAMIGKGVRNPIRSCH
jgi:hypothetical protein